MGKRKTCFKKQVCPSGPRSYVQVVVCSHAWVRVPPLAFLYFFFPFPSFSFSYQITVFIFIQTTAFNSSNASSKSVISQRFHFPTPCTSKLNSSIFNSFLFNFNSFLFNFNFNFNFFACTVILDNQSRPFSPHISSLQTLNGTIALPMH